MNSAMQPLNTKRNHYTEKTPTLSGMLVNEPYDNDKCKLSNIDSSKGWKFSDLELLNDIGFKTIDDYTLECEIEIPSIDITDDDLKIKVQVFKNNDGYNFKTDVRNYVFDSIDDMIAFFDRM